MKNRYRNSDYDQQWNNESYRRNTNQFGNDRSRQNNSNDRAWQNMDNDFDRPNYNYSQSNADNYMDLGNDDYQNRGDRSWHGSQYENQYNSNRQRNSRNDYRRNESSYNNDSGYRNNDNYNNQERGWWDKTTDEVSSWFGDDEAKRRRRMDEMRENNHRGKGPKNYTRSSERIKEDVNDRLGDHWMLDASNIEVEVNGTEVTLTGTVDSKENKRRAEDVADAVSGVTHVQNNLRVNRVNDDNTLRNETSKVNTTDNYKTRKEALNHN